MQVLLSEENQIVNIILIAIGLLALMSIAIVVFFYFSRKKIVRTELEKARLEIDHQKDLLQSTILTQEEERKRIAQDLHDAISSKLNVVSLNANFLTDPSITIEEANKFGESIHKVTSGVLENARRIAHDLLPPTLEKFGLESAIEELCEELIETQRFVLDYQIKYPSGFLKPEAELHVFRMIQELISNSIKYSEATTVTLKIHTYTTEFSMQYSDDGKGFDMDKMKKAKGLGMSGIENRAVILNAHLSVSSSHGNGIQVHLKTTAPHAN